MDKSKSGKLHRRRTEHQILKAANRTEPQDNNRDSDDSSQCAAPVFASVHRPRHVGISAMKREMILRQHQQRQIQQKRQQQHLQQQHQQQHLQQQQQQQQQQHQQQQQQQRQLQQYQHQQQGQHHQNQQQQQKQVQPIQMQIHTLNQPNLGTSQTNGLSFDLVYGSTNCSLPDNGNPNGSTSFKHACWQDKNNGKVSCRQSIAVPIPQPYRQNPSGSFAQPTVNSGNNGTSRIPLAQQQNFNQISKTATNLLNDIYEKHLLNQTTFDNVNMLNNRLTINEGQNFLPMGLNSSHAKGIREVVRQNADGDFNLNNSQQQTQSCVRMQQNHNSQTFQTHIQNVHSVHHLQSEKQPAQHFLKLPPPPIHPPPPVHPLPPPYHQFPPNSVYTDGNSKRIQHLYETIPEKLSTTAGQDIPKQKLSTSPHRILRKRPPNGRSVQKNESVKQLTNSSSILEQEDPSNKTPKLPIQKKHINVIKNGIQSQQIRSIMNPLASQPNFSIPLQCKSKQNQLPLATQGLSYSSQQRTCADGENNQKFIYDDTQSSNLRMQQLKYLQHQEILTKTTDNSKITREMPVGAVEHNAHVEECVLESGLLDKDDVKKLPVVLEEDIGTPIQTTTIEGGVAIYPYRNSTIDLRMETAQAMAAAAYYARAAQKLAQHGTSRSRATDMSSTSRNGGYCGALQRAPPPLPTGLARRLANKENYGIGKVKVMLRVSDNHTSDGTEAPAHFMVVDKKKRQVTLTDPMAANNVTTANSQERGPMVAAPKMFAFDGLYTTEDQQTDVCASALSEVIPAVLEGSDGCLLTIGYPSSGQSRTMLGAINSSNELGAIPCAISWLYKGINERRQKSGARFSVRVSALGVSATKPDSTAKDLLAAHATESDDSPGVYLRDDFLGGPTELRAPTAERAALFLDAALAGRPLSGLEPAMIFTLHVYQYSLSRKGGVAGGRSRLHLIDLGGCANRNGGIPLSGIGNILLAILSGQRHPPNKDHPLTPLLKDCLAPLTCHVAIMAHVSHTQTHSDALTTIQLASRIHRMRRRKHRFPISSDKTLGVNAAHQSAGSSEGPDPSSSDLSADTVIYMGPCDEATDGEHPPVYLPSLSSGDNRCAMNKALKGSTAERQTKIPPKKIVSQKPQSPMAVKHTDSLKRVKNVSGSSSPTPPSTEPTNIVSQFYSSPVHSSPHMIPHSASSPKIVAGAFRNTGINKGSNVPSPKGSPLRRPNHPQNTNSATQINPDSPMRKVIEEQWIDGPRVSRAKVAEARHLMREINHVKHCETWIDGPKSQSAKSLTAGNLPTNIASQTAGYGFMDSHKKTMIRQWVENQSSHVFQPSTASSPTHQTSLPTTGNGNDSTRLRNLTYHLTQVKPKSEDDQHSLGSNIEMINPIGAGLINVMNTTNSSLLAENYIRTGLRQTVSRDEGDLHSEKSSLHLSHLAGSQPDNHSSGQDEEDQDSGPSEVPPALPLIEPLGSREISHESLHRIISRHVSRESLAMAQHNMGMSDYGLQVTEEEIALTMGNEHPLAALSHGDMSVVSSFNIGDAFSDCAMGERARNQFDQLARLREIFTSQLAMAEVTPHIYRLGNDAGSVYSEPAFRFNTGPGSVCSEPPYRPPSPRQSLNPSRTPSQTSLPSLDGIMQIAGMEQYASLRHPDGASDPNLPRTEKSAANEEDEFNEKSSLLSKRPSLEHEEKNKFAELPIITQTQLPLLPLNTSSEAYDSGHDSSTPRTSKHSGISRRAESGYHSVATARDSDESSFTSAISKEHNRITMNKKKRHDKSGLCNWLMNPFTCTYPETEGEISDF